MDLTGVTYGQRVHQDGREVTRKECFDACAQAEHCAQAVCYDAGRSVWKDDSPCTCYPMNTASYLDQPDDGSCEGGSDCEGGSNTGFASIHCKSTPIVCTRPGDTTGYAIESEALEVPNFAVAFTGGACAAGYEGTPKADPCSASGPYTLSGCTPSEFYCLGGVGGPCYQATTSCFFDDGDPPGCPNMGNWIPNTAEDYTNTYESFQTFCSSWSSNGGTFNGGVGSCPYEKLAAGEKCGANAGIGSWEECKKAAASLGLTWTAEYEEGYGGVPHYSHTPLGCWFWDGARLSKPPNELGFSFVDGYGNDPELWYDPICVCGHERLPQGRTPCPT